MVQRIRELCKAKGITIAELERRCEIGNGIIARWKKSCPSYERLAKVAEELDTTVEYLMGEEKAPTHDGERELPHAEYREVLAEGGMRLLMDADAKIPEEHVEEIVEFIKMKQRKYGR